MSVYFIIGSVTGFLEISKNFNLCEMFVCILVLISNIGAIFLQLTDYLNTIIKNEKNKLYISSFFIFICSLLIIGVSNIGIIFGIWGIIMSICKSVYAVFLNDDIKIDQAMTLMAPLALPTAKQLPRALIALQNLIVQIMIKILTQKIQKQLKTPIQLRIQTQLMSRKIPIT